jgi:selenocysteine-specific translation elongation factor
MSTQLERALQTKRIRTAQAALLRALDLIGEPEVTDHDLARIIVDHAFELRALGTLRGRAA